MQQRDVGEGGSPIGSRLPDLQLYVLDEVGEPVPVGVVGELYVGGEGVTRGYLNRAGLTAQRFVPDGFSGRAGARLYRTGDLGRWKEDGSLEYVGRNDEQVKVRGYRIELGEIESQLQRHAQVSAAAVVAQAGASAEKRLVAYYTLKAEPSNKAGLSGSKSRQTALEASQSLSSTGHSPLEKLTGKPGPQELRQYLEAHLPHYMVPAGYVELESIPLTGNGKVDRKRLPVWQATEHQTHYEAPRTRTERTLCEVWERVLQVERVGVTDNYFALGGDSILSIQVLWQAREAGLSFTLADLLRHQTIRALCEQVQSAEGSKEWVKVGAFELLSEAERQRHWPEHVEDAYPLSRLQEGMYFHSELDRESATYHDIFSYGVRKPFVESAFNEALQALVKRHAVLRTAIDAGEGGRLLQVVYREVPLRAQVEDLTERGPQQQKQYLMEWLEQEKRQGFEWDRAPLLRVFVHVLAAERFRYTLSFHHLMLDGWSVASLQTELLEVYLGRLVGQVVKPEALKAQFRDYIAQEQRALSSLDSERYWKEQLSEASVWSVPAEASLLGKKRGQRSEQYTTVLEGRLSTGLLRKAQELGSHPKVLLLAAHVKVMSVLSGQRDVLTGLVWNGRLEEEDGDRVLGLYLNSVPLRVRLGDGSWRELIGQVQRQEQELVAHRRYPLSKIQEVLGYGELFSTLFNYVQFHVYEKLSETGVVIGADTFEQTNFALTVTFSQSVVGERVSLSLGYDCGVLTAQQVQRIAGYYQAALEHISGQIEASHDAHALLSEDELEKVLRQFNTFGARHISCRAMGEPQSRECASELTHERLGAPGDEDRCIHELFEEQVRRAPDAVALVCEAVAQRMLDSDDGATEARVLVDRSLSYGQLNARANQLARYLRSQGVGPDQRVGLCMDRGPQMVIGLLGILKAGGAYVPLDPGYPARRLEYLVADAAPVMILTQERLKDLPGLSGARCGCVDSQWEQIQEYGQDNLSREDSGVTPRHLAYVIYTSGSTGEPKGVMASGAASVNRLLAQEQVQAITAQEICCQKTSIGFVDSVFETLGALLGGAPLVVADQEQASDVQQLMRLCSRYGVTRLVSVPSLAQTMLEAGAARDLKGLRSWTLSGEALGAELLRRLREALPECRILNLYGSSEVSADATWYDSELAADPPQPKGGVPIGRPLANTQVYVLDGQAQPVTSVPIGRPLRNTQVYVLDEQGQPAPIGVWGEICVGGRGVARGYLGRPELTAERFVSDPFGEPGGRLYRTGDVGRWRVDGQLEYQGRLDHQVKVRGYRIELGEIESQLRAHEGVGDAVVMVREDGTGQDTGHGTGDSTGDGIDPSAGQKRLVAYVTPRSRSPEHLDLTERADTRGAQDQTTAAVPSNPARGQDSSPDVTPSVDVESVDVDTLRAYLRERVPPYMVPAAFVVLPRLPLTPNGKVDRTALPTPGVAAYQRDQYEPPQGEVEVALAQIWQSLLSVEQVGRQDDFFQLGGHSLLAAQMVSQVRAVLERELVLREVFERPTLAALARALLKAAHSDKPIDPLADRSGPLPLSYMQQRLWYLDQLNAQASRAYHLGATLRLQGELDVTALRSALDRIVCRHETLRTVFRNEEGQAVQVILLEAPFRLLEKDLSALEAEERQSRLTREIQEEAQTSFDLSRGPLIRGRLLKQAADDHVLLLRMHHIICDGWSVGLLVKELSTLYSVYRQGAGDRQGVGDRLPKLPIQYADYARWQRQRLQGESPQTELHAPERLSGDRLQEQLHYWVESLQGAPELLSLPTDHARPTQASYRGDSVAVVLEESLSEGLRQLSQRHGTTLFMTLYGAFAVLLSRLAGQEDVVIGTPVANRPRVELEDLIGFFVNTLALRCRVNSQMRVCELLQAVKRQTLSAYSHQEVPLERVVEAAQPQRSLSYSPIFQVMFALQNAPRSQWELPGLKLSAPVGMGGMSTAQFDLTLSLQEARGRIVGVLNYARDLFDRGTIEGWVECLQELLQGMVRDDQQRVAELALLNERQREQVLRQFNARDAHRSPGQGIGEPGTREGVDELEGVGEWPDGLRATDRCIHELFEEQAERTPDAVAVVYEEQSLSYAQVNGRANQLARYLKSQGVGADDRVGLCTQRSPEMVIGLLGILKSGGAYVPLDAGYPGERQGYVLKDAQPVALVVDSAHSEVAQRSRALGVPVVEWGEAEVQRQSTANLDGRESKAREAGARERAARAHTLAYMIYTSGSTGEPKGVMVEHAQVVRLFESTRGWFEFGSADVWTLFHSVSFDFSVWELWGALLFGGRLVVVPQLIARSPQEFYELLCRQGVTVLNQTPSAFRQLIAAQGQVGDRATAGGHALRRVILGGEALDPGMLKAWYERHAEDAPRLVNMYGITETTVHVTYREMQQRDVGEGGSPIGSRLPDLQLYVLDEVGEPVPVGVVGELYVGGEGVTRGYLNRAGLTAQRFVPDGFSGRAGARLYRTGDLGRWKEDGSLEYVGRNDEQVKVRGYRIELGEIESQLQRHAQVSAAAVVAQAGASAEKRLVAYYTLKAEPVGKLTAGKPGPQELRQYLEAHLPHYMVPAGAV